MAKKKGVSKTELTALLDGQIADARDYDSGDLSAKRIKALEYEEGTMVDVPALKGRSSVVSRDVADTIGLIEPGIIRVMLGADEIVRYEPKRPEHEDIAKQETDYVNHIVMMECDGYRQLKFAIRDGLRHGNGIIKHFWDPTPKYSVERFTGLDDTAYNQLVADEEVEEVLEHTEYPDPSHTYGAGGDSGVVPASGAPAIPGGPAGPGG